MISLVLQVVTSENVNIGSYVSRKKEKKANLKMSSDQELEAPVEDVAPPVKRGRGRPPVNTAPSYFIYRSFCMCICCFVEKGR